MNFLENHARGDRSRPFFHQCSFPDPHHPFDCPEPWSLMYDPKDVPLPKHRQRDLERRPWWHRAALESKPEFVLALLDDRAKPVATQPADATARESLSGLLAELNEARQAERGLQNALDSARADVSRARGQLVSLEALQQAALRERVALLKGLPLEVIGQVLDTRITLTPGGKFLASLARHAPRLTDSGVKMWHDKLVEDSTPDAATPRRTINASENRMPVPIS